MFQVFTAGALHLESLSKVTGDGGAKAPYAPLKPWPISERERILGQIKKLPFVNDTHYAEWCAWFAQLKEVRKGTLKKFVFNVCRIPANSQKTSCLLGQSHCSYLARLLPYSDFSEPSKLDLPILHNSSTQNTPTKFGHTRVTRSEIDAENDKHEGKIFRERHPQVKERPTPSSWLLLEEASANE
jgi:hypothetical protein